MTRLNPRRPWFKSLAQLLAALMLLNPLVGVAGALSVDNTASHNTRINTAASGVPVIDIATPNDSVLSHNQFSEYNVTLNGLILDNSIKIDRIRR